MGAGETGLKAPLGALFWTYLYEVAELYSRPTDGKLAAVFAGVLGAVNAAVEVEIETIQRNAPMTAQPYLEPTP